MKEYELTVNLYPRNTFKLSAWNLHESQEEPERISVRRGEKEYAIVFDKRIRFEVWSIDSRGEINERILAIEEDAVKVFDDLLKDLE